MSMKDGSLSNVEGDGVDLQSDFLLTTELARNLVREQGWGNLNAGAQAAIRYWVGKDIADSKARLAKGMISAEREAALTTEMETAEDFLGTLT